ncbi:MAG TPA: hypothetical protein VHV47_06520 [Opitutaceae bacterium]|jgi:hypothetical protein|nr:hypothetical protein [Opitutaceae bacterium]
MDAAKIDSLIRFGHFLAHPMKACGYTYWQDGRHWIGYLDEFPDYLTQGKNLKDLQVHLRDLYRDLASGEIPNVRRHAELKLA